MKGDYESRPYHLCFETFANELRIKIIENLKKRQMSVEELSQKVHAERSRVSHSLKMLRECSYVEIEKKGKHRFYSLKKDSFNSFDSNEDTQSFFRVLDSHIDCFCKGECKKLRA